MTVRIRMFLLFMVCTITNAYAFSYKSGVTLFSEVPFSLIAALFCSIAYCYIKWIVRIHRESGVELKNWLLIEVFLVPALILGMISIPVAGLSVIGIEFLGFYILAVVFSFDVGRSIETYLWNHRFYEFSNLPDDAIVGAGLLKSYRQFMLTFLILIPVIGWILGLAY